MPLKVKLEQGQILTTKRAFVLHFQAVTISFFGGNVQYNANPARLMHMDCII